MGRLVRLFEKVNPGGNSFFIHGETGALGVSNEQHFVTPNFHYFSTVDEELMQQINREALSSDLVFVQAATTVNQAILEGINDGIPKHLFLWGFETYLHHSFHYKQVFPQTRQFLFGQAGSKKGNLTYFKRYLKEWQRDKHRFDYFKKVDSFSAGFKEEADWMKKKIGLSQPFFPFSFYSHELHSMKETYDVHSKWLLLGNSATVTMNHVDAIPFLEHADLERIILPLSYGDKSYKEFVKQKFLKKFPKDRLTFLEEYMPLEEYEELMGKCGLVYINAYCQQAVGNCINALSKGSALFFPPKGFLYRGFKGLGYQVFEPKDIRNFDLQEYTLHGMKRNFRLFSQDRNPIAQEEKVKDIINYYRSHGKK